MSFRTRSRVICVTVWLHPVAVQSKRNEFSADPSLLCPFRSVIMSLFICEDPVSTASRTADLDYTPIAGEPTDTEAGKVADLAGPGIGDYADLEQILPQNYHPLLTPKETQHAIFR